MYESGLNASKMAKKINKSDTRNSCKSRKTYIPVSVAAQQHLHSMYYLNEGKLIILTHSGIDKEVRNSNTTSQRFSTNIPQYIKQIWFSKYSLNALRFNNRLLKYITNHFITQCVLPYHAGHV